MTKGTAKAAKRRPRASLDQPVSEPPEEVRAVVEALVDDLGDDLSAVYWHGSEARAEAKPDSDHDLIIILKRADDEVLIRLQRVFQARDNWSTYVQTEEELRQYPSTGRLQFHFGLVPLFGEFEAPQFTRENVVADLRQLVLEIRFESRFRLLHAEADYAEIEPQYLAFRRSRNARMLRYAAKLAVLALKARELVSGRAYPNTRDELRSRLSDEDDLAIVDIVDLWEELRPDFEEDLTPLALQLDAFARKLVHELDSGLLK